MSRVLQLEAGENRCDLTLASLSTHNLLVNGDFEAGFAAARSVEHGQEGVRDPWRFRFTPGINCYIYPESIYEWRKPRIRYGREAISQVTDGHGTMELYQDVVVDANQPLLASAWVLALDVQGDGQGFGAGPQDFAGLVVQELDLQDGVLVSHERVGLTKPAEDFQHVTIAIHDGSRHGQSARDLDEYHRVYLAEGSCHLRRMCPGNGRARAVTSLPTGSDSVSGHASTRCSRRPEMKTGLGMQPRERSTSWLRHLVAGKRTRSIVFHAAACLIDRASVAVHGESASDAVRDLSTYLGKMPALVVVVCGEANEDLATVTQLVEQTPWTIFCRSTDATGPGTIRDWAREQGHLGKRVYVVDDNTMSLYLADGMADAVWVAPDVQRVRQRRTRSCEFSIRTEWGLLLARPW